MTLGDDLLKLILHQNSPHWPFVPSVCPRHNNATLLCRRTPPNPSNRFHESGAQAIAAICKAQCYHAKSHTEKGRSRWARCTHQRTSIFVAQSVRGDRHPRAWVTSLGRPRPLRACHWPGTTSSEDHARFRSHLPTRQIHGKKGCGVFFGHWSKQKIRRVLGVICGRSVAVAWTQECFSYIYFPSSLLQHRGYWGVVV